jgi:BirA family biotin operon repressor/biotin-[acetyl-CoA-carboxylase] ligase
MPYYLKVSQTASTNSYLSRLAATLPSGTVIYTPSQTAGRGQKGNTWESEDGKNLTFSLLLKCPPVKARDQFYLSEAAALAVVEALAAEAGEGFAVKWPNDVYWQDKKVCGMLL